jgi:diguanylate cyclase (GGDEF)-like protein
VVSYKPPPRFDALKAADQLPSPSGVVMALLRLVDSETTSVAEIAHVLETDPALAGRILKLANSASAGASRTIASVRDAVTRLGVRTLRNSVLAFSLVAKYGRGTCRQFDYQGFWSQSLAAAVAAQLLARNRGSSVPEEAFTAGLLCQVGRLALASIYPQEYGDILGQQAADPDHQLVRLEREAFATDHNEFTAALLQNWGLPRSVIEAAHYHEHPQQGVFTAETQPPLLAQLLHLAVQLAAVCVCADNQRGEELEELSARGKTCGMNRGELLPLADDTAREWIEWGQVLAVPTKPVPRLTDPGPDYPVDAAAVGEASTGVEPLRVMIVDDDPIEVRLLSHHLRAAGHTVLSAANGQEGLRLALEASPQLVITDWMMPVIDGLAFCRALRRTKHGRQMYVIMLTGCEDEEHLVQAFEAGTDDYVVKPFRPRMLLARVRAARRVVHLQAEVNRDQEAIRHYLADLAVANRKLQEAAFTDVLTQLPNRRYALGRLDQEWCTAQRADRSLACLLIDIDHFKKVNDSYGHDVGDAVLREAATRLREALRRNDVVCRLGGEEFLVICPDTGQLGGELCAERLRGTIAATPIQALGVALPVTVSVGLAIRTPGLQGPDDLLKAADQGVYAAKATGRNRVCVADTAEVTGRRSDRDTKTDC